VIGAERSGWKDSTLQHPAIPSRRSG